MDLVDFGLIGLGVMGENLALNIEEKGFSIAVYNRTSDKIEELLEKSPGKRLVGAHTLPDLVAAVARPRRILMMVKAGAPVDATLEQLVPLLDPGDVIIDGGNEHFTLTEKRGAAIEAKGLHYVGMGVSGGEEGARHGPSMMPGGTPQAYALLAPVLTKIAAQVSDGPCVTHIGPGGSGHYVKMVHNGIEYGDMQLIAEAYDVLRTLGGLGTDELSDVFRAWNQGELESFLIEITARIFKQQDDLGTGAALVDVILDAAEMKGTGTWTVAEGAALLTPIPTIASAVDARLLSRGWAMRQRAGQLLAGPSPTALTGVDRQALIDDVRHALYAAKACSYAQGLALLRTASLTHEWGLRLDEIARIWKGGCIIRAAFLGRIQDAYRRDPDLEHLLFDAQFAEELGARQGGWRRTLARAVEHGVGVPTLSGSLAYYDSLRRGRMPQNLTQAQRDFFGAHTYQRTDREGVFHAKWD